MLTLNASQLATLIGTRPDVTWRALRFWKYFGQICRVRHTISCVNVFTPPCYDLVDVSEHAEDGFIQYDTGRRISCCEKVTRFFVDTFRWMFYGKDERNCGRGRDDEKSRLELLHENWAPISFPVQKQKRVVMDGVEICGIPDAVRTEDGMLVELKCRRNMLFDQIPTYELFQLYAYMFLFEKHEIVQVQFYQSKFRVHIVRFIPAVWGRLLTKIGKVKQAVITFRNTPEDRGLYLQHPQEFVNKYMRMIS